MRKVAHNLESTSNIQAGDALDPKSRWKLVLGEKNTPDDGSPGLEGDALRMDRVLDALYGSEKQRGLGDSMPHVQRWLGEIRSFFPTSVVRMMQMDAIDRLGLAELLAEPEVLDSLEPDIHLISSILQLKDAIPDKSKAAARMLVRRLAEKIAKDIGKPLKSSIRGSLQKAKRTRRPVMKDVDWQRTILYNLKHYDPDHKRIVPERIFGFKRRKGVIRHLYILVDQSGSMASSTIYAAVYASVMASIGSLETRLYGFDSSVVDLSEHISDPVDLLLGMSLGGGTDIGKALQYADRQISRPRDSVLLLISDLEEGYDRGRVLRAFDRLKRKGVTCLSILSLTDEGHPEYDEKLAEQVAALDIPVFACTPDRFPSVISKLLGR